MIEKKLIIVDDSALMRNQLSSFLNEQGYSVIAQGVDGLEAVNLYKKYSPDLITLDITMPNKNGIDAIREIKEFDPESIIVVITSIQGEIILDCILAGAKGAIQKPLRFNDPVYRNEFISILECALDKTKTDVV